MELSNFVAERHVVEALRLFKVSTWQAAQSGHLAGVEGAYINTIAKCFLQGYCPKFKKDESA